MNWGLVIFYLKKHCGLNFFLAASFPYMECANEQISYNFPSLFGVPIFQQVSSIGVVCWLLTTDPKSGEF
jgi:hypothetical protein